MPALPVTDEQGNTMSKTIAFFPEAAFGPALNSVGIAQAVEALGHRAVFLSDPGFVSVYEGYGFEVTGPEFDEDGVMHVPMARAAVQ